MRSKRERAARWIAAVLAVLVLSVVGLLGWVHTAAGRRSVARHVEAAITAQIRGELHVASIDRVSWRGLRAHGVRFTAPNGDDVIVADHADLEMAWGALLRGRFVATHASVEGGRVLLHDDGEGTLSIDTTMRSRHAGDSPAHGTARDPTVDLRRIDVSGITLVVRVHDVPDMRVTHIRGALQITVRAPGGALLLRLSDLGGRGHVGTPLPIAVRLTGGTFRFDGGSDERVRADARAVLDGDAVGLRCVARMHRAESHVALRLVLPARASPLDHLPTIVQTWAAAITSSHFDFGVVRE